MPGLEQTSFAGGVVSARVAARSDLAKAKVAVSAALNVRFAPEGSAENRPGSRYAQRCLTDGRLIPFEFSNEQQYALWFGDRVLRVVRDGSWVYDDSITAVSATQANPMTVTTAVPHGWSNGDEVDLGTIFPELAGRSLLVANATTSAFQVTDFDGSLIDSSGFGAFTSGPIQRVYELETPYAWEDIQLDPEDETKPGLKFTQSHDVMTLTHIGYYPRHLTRTDHNQWTLDTILFEPATAYPTDISVTVNATGGRTISYAVVAQNDETGEQSLLGLPTTFVNITDITQANRAVITVDDASSIYPGEEVYVDSVSGMTEMNFRRFIVEDVDGNEITARQLDSSQFSAYTGGGRLFQGHYTITNAHNNAGSVNNTISWAKAVGADRYIIYKRDTAGFGFIGETRTTSFLDDAIEPDVVDSPPTWRNPFDQPGLYPQATTYWEQRSAWGGSTRKPHTLYLSQAAAYETMTKSTPSKDSDAITRTINADKANDIRHLVPVADLLVMTGGATRRVWADGGSVTPTNLVTKPQTREGSSHVRPLIVRDRALYVEQGGRRVYDLGYQLEPDAYVGNDRTVLAADLTKSRRIVEWDYDEEERTAWVLYDDGGFALFTYLPEQDVWAWGPCATDGRVLSVCAARDRAFDGRYAMTLYLMVERYLPNDPSTRRLFLEYVRPLRRCPSMGTPDAYHVDCGLTFDNPMPVLDIVPSNPAVVHFNGNVAEGATVDIEGVRVRGDSVRPSLLDDINKDGWMAVNVQPGQFELHDSNGDPVDGTGWGQYWAGGNVRVAVHRVEGAWHLVGADVVANANGHAVTGLVVDADGGVDLEDASSRVHLGLAYDAYLDSIDLDYQDDQGATGGRDKGLATVYLDVMGTQGIEVGRTDARMVPVRECAAETVTGVVEQNIAGKAWDRRVRLRVRQPYPLPMTILGYVVDPEIGE